MKTPFFYLIRIGIILASATVTIFATVDGWRTFGVLVAGLIFHNFFSSQVYDPVFKNQSAQGWLLSELKKRTPRRKPVSKYDI